MTDKNTPFRGTQKADNARLLKLLTKKKRQADEAYGPLVGGGEGWVQLPLYVVARHMAVLAVFIELAGTHEELSGDFVFRATDHTLAELDKAIRDFNQKPENYAS